MEPPTPRASTAIERSWLRRVLRSLGEPPLCLVLWDGAEIASGARPQTRLHLPDRRSAADLLFRPDPGLAEAYCEGRVRVEGDLLRLLEAIWRGPQKPAPWWVSPLSGVFRGALRSRSTDRSRSHVHHHYDVGNDFYRLWLDEQMVYTCAYFARPELGLEAAQVAKLDHVCRKLGLRPGERVVEAGCGWGALALHMAEHYGARVRAYNVSHEQLAYAREQARRRGLEERVEFIEEDYREIRGECDVFVSVGMLEHVGRQHYRQLSRVIDRVLSHEGRGRGLLHSIGRAEAQRMSPWIEKTIFPGAYLPTLGEMLEVFEPAALAVLDVENLRRHYTRTLEHWLDRLEKAADPIVDRWDERLLRSYRLYLASSIASFRTGSNQLYQILFSRPGDDVLPWTRAHLYLNDERD